MTNRLAPWIVGNILVLGLFIQDFLHAKSGNIASAAYWGRDFINIWTSGKLVLAGRLGALYDLDVYHAFQISLFGPIGMHNFSYPPLVLPLMAPFALLPYPLALALWLTGTGWLFVHAAKPWWKQHSGLPVWLALATPAAAMNIWAGHYGFLMGALLLFGWRFLDVHRPIAAGVCFGLMAIKPHLAILVPLILLIRRDWIAIFAGGVTVGLLIIASILLFGTELWQQYLFGTLDIQAGMINASGQFFQHMSTSTATALLQFGLPSEIALGLQVVQAVIAAALVAIAARRARLSDVALLASTATFLILPYAFNYDLTVSAMGAAIIMDRRTLDPNWRRLAIGGFLAPQLGLVMSACGLPCMPLLLLGLMIVQFRVAVFDPRISKSRHSSEEFRTDFIEAKPAG